MKFLKIAVYVFTYLFLIIVLCVVKIYFSENCTDEYMDMNNHTIKDISQFCNDKKDKKCIVKCCGMGEVLGHYGNSCLSTEKVEKIKSKHGLIGMYSDLTDYSNVTIFSWDGSAPNNTSKNLEKDFTLVQNTRLRNDKCSFEDYFYIHYYIMENATLKKLKKENGPYITLEALDYCVDYRVKFFKNMSVEIVLRRLREPDRTVETYFVACGMMVSCVFILLTLVVYCALPQLQNLVGMILMGYLTSFFMTCLLRSVTLLPPVINQLKNEQCRVFSIFLYFFAISSFCWLNIMSLDIWWTFRGNRKCRDIHRRGELSKFKRYCLFAWGVPLLYVAGVVVVDICMDLPAEYRPPFDNCFAEDKPVFYYLHIPIMIIIGLNIILFLMTGYNIWLIKRGVSANPEYRSTKKDENRLTIYIKLAVLMGVNWAFELLPDKVPTYLYIFGNSFIVFMGVAIFFLFVFKMKILFMLCSRFNIKCKFVENLQASHNTRSGSTITTRTSTFKSSRSQKESIQETNM